MYPLLNFALSIFTHLFFLFVIAKGMSGDWKLRQDETTYLLMTGLILSIIRVPILQFSVPNLSAHLISDMNFLMICFVYFPAVFLYYYKMKGYPGRIAAAFTATLITIAQVSDIAIDFTSAAFFPGMRLHWEMTLEAYPFLLLLHLTLHGVVAAALVLLFVKTTKNLRRELEQNSRLQAIFLSVAGAAVTVTMTVLLVVYSREEVFFYELWSWRAFAVFIALYLALAGTLIHARILRQRFERQRKDAEFAALKFYTNELELQHSAMRKFKHDYHNILISMDRFFTERDWSGLEQYYTQKIKPASNIMTKGDFALEALGNIKVTEIKGLIASKLIMAQNLDLAIETSFEAFDEIIHIPADSVTLVRMFGIILDNAIEELSALSRGKFSVAFYKNAVQNSLTFIVQNTCRRDIPKLHELKRIGFTTKGKEHGYGLNILDELEASSPNITLSTIIEEELFTQKLTIIYTEGRV